MVSEITNVPAEGVHLDVPEHVYRRWPAMNYSRLKLLDESVELFAYREKHPQRETEALNLGTAIDIRLNEPDTFNDRVACGPDCDRRSNENKKRWADFERAMEGRVIVTPDEMLRIEAIAAAVKEHREAKNILDSGKPQVCIVWRDRETGILLKARLDRLTDFCIADIKSTRDVSPGPFSRDMEAFGYAVQAALYRDGYHAATGKTLEFRIIACQTLPPHRVKVYPIGKESLQCGRLIYRRALYTYKLCLKSGVWKDPDIVEPAIQLPRWKLSEEGIELERDF